jgi:hypothetical protein
VIGPVCSYPLRFDPMNPLIKLQLDLNLTSLSHWQLFGEHRRKVTSLLSDAVGGNNSRLCVLGAGNCNDLELNELLNRYREIHLVDLDADALTAGVERQGLSDNPAVHLHGGMDVTGMVDIVAGWMPRTAISDAELSACIVRPFASMGSVLRGPFEVVASTCLLSQLINAIVRTAGERHPRFVELVQAIRLGHLRLLNHLTSPAGLEILATDVVSSETCSALLTIADETLPSLITQLIREHNFFHGVNPAVLESVYRTDPMLGVEVSQVELIRPWRWDIGPRVYAVFALKVRKRGVLQIADIS